MSPEEGASWPFIGVAGPVVQLSLPWLPVPPLGGNTGSSPRHYCQYPGIATRTLVCILQGVERRHSGTLSGLERTPDPLECWGPFYPPHIPEIQGFWRGRGTALGRLSLCV